MLFTTRNQRQRHIQFINACTVQSDISYINISNGSAYEVYVLLACDSAYIGRQLQTFRMTVLPPSSKEKIYKTEPCHTHIAISLLVTSKYEKCFREQPVSSLK